MQNNFYLKNLKKLIIVFLLLSVSFLSSPITWGQCSIIQPNIYVKSSEYAGGYCVITIDYSFLLQANGGNKYVGVNIWPTSVYPSSLTYNTDPTTSYLNVNGTNIPAASFLIDQTTTIPSLYNSYPNGPNPTPDWVNETYPEIHFQSPTTGITLDLGGTTTISGVNYKLYTVHDLKLYYPAASCTGTYDLKSDIWSAQSAGANKASCTNENLSLGIGTPVISGSFNCGTPYGSGTASNTYSFTANNTGSGSVTFTYAVYRDSYSPTGEPVPNHAYDPGNDALGVSNTTTITIAAGQQWSSGTLTEAVSSITEKDQDLFIVLSNITTGGNTINNAITLPLQNNCAALLPVVFGDIKATINGGKLSINWQTLAEENCKGYEVQASKDGANWKSISKEPSKSSNGFSSQTLNYSITSTFPIAMSLIGFSFLLLAFSKSRLIKMLGYVAIVIFFVSCLKNNSDVNISKKDNLYIRIVQIDKDGNAFYSKTVKAVAE